MTTDGHMRAWHWWRTSDGRRCQGEESRTMGIGVSSEIIAMKYSYKVETTVKNTANIIKTCGHRVRWHEGEEMLQESNCVLLLLTGCIDVREEEGNIVSAD
jgi:hypothetical protein